MQKTHTHPQHEDKGNGGEIAQAIQNIGLVIKDFLLGNRRATTYNYTFVSPDIFVNGVDQDNAANTINYVKPTGLAFIEVEVVGGGGGSGGVSATAAGQTAESGGGGGGGYAIKVIQAVDLGDTEVVTVGDGGAAGAAGANNGSTGGTTSFGSHLTATGGAGGEGMAGNSTAAIVSGGAGGSGTLGDLIIDGGSGGHGNRLNSSPLNGVRLPFGGASQKSPMALGSSGVTVTPVSYNYGSGASGRRITASTAAAAGGKGASGLVIIREYF